MQWSGASKTQAWLFCLLAFYKFQIFPQKNLKNKKSQGNLYRLYKRGRFITVHKIKATFSSQKSLCQLKFFKESLQQEKETHILVFFKLSVIFFKLSATSHEYSCSLQRMSGFPPHAFQYYFSPLGY